MITLYDLMLWSEKGLENASFDFHSAATEYKDSSDKFIYVNNSKLSGMLSSVYAANKTATTGDYIIYP